MISKNDYLGARLNEVVQSVKGKNNPESFKVHGSGKFKIVYTNIRVTKSFDNRLSSSGSVVSIAGWLTPFPFMSLKLSGKESYRAN